MQRFELIYDRMLYEVREKKPDCTMILIAPFIFRMKDESSDNDIFNDWDIWYKNVRQRGEITKKLADKYDARFLPMLDIF